MPAPDDSVHQQVTSAITDGWMGGGDFLGSVLAGTLVGYGLDWWFGTDPWLVVTGIVLGSYTGFMRVWHFSKVMVPTVAVTDAPPTPELDS